MKTQIENWRGVLRDRDDNGFSLLEVVVAVSIMLILAIAGVIGYQGYQDNARDAAVETAAQQVYTAGLANLNSPNGDDLDKVAADYTTSSDGITTTITETEDDICVHAVMDDRPEHAADRGDCEGVDAPAPGDNNNGDGDDNNGEENNGAFSLETNVDGNWGGADQMQFDATSLYPGESAYAPVLIRTTPDTTLDGEVSANASGTSGSFSPHLNYRATATVLDAGSEAGFTCDASSFSADANYVFGSANSADTSLQATGQGSGTQDVSAGSRDVVAYCFHVQMSSDAPNEVQGQSAAATWTFNGESDITGGTALHGEATANGVFGAAEIPAAALTRECEYAPGLLGMGQKVDIHWDIPEGYTLDDVEFHVSSAGLGTVLVPMTGFNLYGNTQTAPDGYTTEVPTDLLSDLFGLYTDVELAIVINDPQSEWTSEATSVATNAVQAAGLAGSCRNLS